jgi:hypothetical protein
MFRHGSLAPAVIACFAALPAWAATDDDLAQIRSQIRELKETYEARIRALEEKLQAAEARSAQPPPPAAAPAPVATTAAPASTSPGAFNPAISAILAGQYANLSQDPAGFRIPGFLTGGDIGPGRRGFSIAESELQLAANVDHRFSGNLIFSIAPDNSVEVEEAYGIATALPGGFTPKFGRFLSAQGYLNEQHAHAWDFVDAPLAYQAFFGGQYRTDGVQLKWLAPLDHYVEIGGEVGSSDAFPGSSRSKNGAGSGVVYARTGGDVGESHSWLAGVSYLQTHAQDRISSGIDRSGEEKQVAFSGKSQVAIADFVWKYAPNGNARETNRHSPGLRRGFAVPFAPGRVVRAGRVPVHADVARGIALRPPGSRERGLRREPAAPANRRLRAAARRGDGRLESLRVQPAAAAIRAGQNRRGHHRQRVVRAVHPESWCAWSAQVLGGRWQAAGNEERGRK